MGEHSQRAADALMNLHGISQQKLTALQNSKLDRHVQSAAFSISTAMRSLPSIASDIKKLHEEESYIFSISENSDANKIQRDVANFSGRVRNETQHLTGLIHAASKQSPETQSLLFAFETDLKKIQGYAQANVRLLADRINEFRISQSKGYELPKILTVNAPQALDKIVLAHQQDHDDLFDRLKTLHNSFEEALIMITEESEEKNDLQSLKADFDENAGLNWIWKSVKELIEENVFSVGKWEAMREEQTQSLENKILNYSGGNVKQMVEEAARPLLGYYEQSKKETRDFLNKLDKELEQYETKFSNLVGKVAI